jgi:AcrR family transcriptional regulator
MAATDPPTRPVKPEAERLPSGRHGLTRRFVIRNQRERMLAASAQAVAERGYAHTNVADIIAIARVSRRTFYEHFSDKEDCLLAAYDAVVQQLFRAVSEAYLAESDWCDRVHAGLTALAEFVTDEPDFARMCFLEAPLALAAGRRRRADAMALFASFLEPERGRPTNLGVPHLAVEVIVGGLYEVIYSRLAAGHPEQLLDELPEIVYCALVPFAGHAEAQAVRERVAASARRAEPVA